jgi:hypothetical protein
MHPTFVVRVAVTWNQSYCGLSLSRGKMHFFRPLDVAQSGSKGLLLAERGVGLRDDDDRPNGRHGRVIVFSITANASCYTSSHQAAAWPPPQDSTKALLCKWTTGRGRRCGHWVACSSSCEGPFDPQHALLGSELSRSVPSAPSVPSLRASTRAACLLVIA